MEAILTAKNIDKYYGDKKVLNNVSMNINRGDIYGFIGATKRKKERKLQVNITYEHRCKNP